MDRHSRTRLVGIAVVAGLLATGYFLYPWVDENYLSLGEQVAKAREDRDERKVEAQSIDLARRTYKKYLNRVGTLDPHKARTQLQLSLDRLAGQYHLEGTRSTVTSPGKADRKTGVWTLKGNLSGACTLEAATNLVRDVYELPYLLSVTKLSLKPEGRSRGQKKTDGVSLTLSLEALVLPDCRKTMGKLKDEELAPLERLVRHSERDYAPIYEENPFKEWRPTPPLVVDAGREVSGEVNARKSLTGTARQGTPPYRYTWSPAERLMTGATTVRPRIDTSEPFEADFVFTVTDAEGQTATDQVHVVITEAVVRDVPETTPTPRAPSGPTRWAGARKQAVSVAKTSHGDKKVAELAVFDSQEKRTEYYQAGAEFDGGTLMYVHPRGAVVRRADAYYIYPLGDRLDQDIPADLATDYPHLQRAVTLLKEHFASAEPVEVEPLEDQPDDVEDVQPEEPAEDTNPARPKTTARTPVDTQEDGSARPDRASDTPRRTEPAKEPSTTRPSRSRPATAPRSRPGGIRDRYLPGRPSSRPSEPAENAEDQKDSSAHSSQGKDQPTTRRSTRTAVDSSTSARPGRSNERRGGDDDGAQEVDPVDSQPDRGSTSPVTADSIRARVAGHQPPAIAPSDGDGEPESAGEPAEQPKTVTRSVRTPASPTERQRRSPARRRPSVVSDAEVSPTKGETIETVKPSGVPAEDASPIDRSHDRSDANKSAENIGGKAEPEPKRRTARDPVVPAGRQRSSARPSADRPKRAENAGEGDGTRGEPLFKTPAANTERPGSGAGAVRAATPAKSSEAKSKTSAAAKGATATDTKSRLEPRRGGYAPASAGVRDGKRWGYRGSKRSSRGRSAATPRTRADRSAPGSSIRSKAASGRSRSGKSEAKDVTAGDAKKASKARGKQPDAKKTGKKEKTTKRSTATKSDKNVKDRKSASKKGESASKSENKDKKDEKGSKKRAEAKSKKDKKDDDAGASDKDK